MAKQTTTVASRPVRRTTAASRRAQPVTSPVRWGFPLTTTNYLILGVGIAMLVIAYVLMSTAIGADPLDNEGTWNNQMAVSVAPVLLAIAYCAVIPIGIFYRGKRRDADETGDGNGASV